MTFTYESPRQRIVSGTGAIDLLAEELMALGTKHALIVCGASVRNNGLAAQIEVRIGSACAGVFDKVAAHSPLAACRDLAAQARRVEADAFITVGGGSASDTAKIAAVLLAEGDDVERHASRFEPPDRFLPVQLHRPKLPIIAIPTTASAAEATFGAGVRMPTGEKLVVWDQKLAARVISLTRRLSAERHANCWRRPR